MNSLARFEVAMCEPVIDKDTSVLAFRAKGEYLSLVNFTAYHGILEVAPGVLRSLMSRMKIKKAGNLTHRLRVELFLQTVGCEQDYIESVLAQIPEKPVRQRKARHEEEDASLVDEDCVSLFHVVHFFVGVLIVVVKGLVAGH